MRILRTIIFAEFWLRGNMPKNLHTNEAGRLWWKFNVDLHLGKYNTAI